MNNLILLDPYIIERDGPIPPVIWNVENGLVYQDIKADRYEETVEFLLANWFTHETLCRSTGILHDEESRDEMCNLIRFLLKDECSLAAIDAETDCIKGVVVMKIMWKSHYSWPFWRLLCPTREGSLTANIIQFHCEFMKYCKALPESLDISRTVHFYMVAVAPDMKGRLLNENMMLNAVKIARSVGAKSVTQICTSLNDRERARRIGFKKIDEKIYKSYTDENELPIFTNLDSGEHNATLFGCAIGPQAATSLGEYLFPEDQVPPPEPAIHRGMPCIEAAETDRKRMSSLR